MSPTAEKSFESLIGFGANKGDTLATFRAVEAKFDADPAILDWTSSSVISTKAVTGATSNEDSTQEDYSNAVIRIRTTLSAAALHDLLQQLEQQFGRQRDARWSPRIVDLDLLLYGNTRLDSPQLTIPHPRMSFRRFVLEPAVEIAAEMTDPASGMSLRQLLDHLDSSRATIVLVTDEMDSIQSLAAELPFELQITDCVGDFIRLANDARLVVSVFDKSNEDASTGEIASLIRYAENFAGPMLRIDRNLSSEEISTELRAAFTAMQ